MPTFETGIIPVNAFKVKMKDPSGPKSKKKAVASVFLDGRELLPTERFMKSMMMRFRFRDTIYKYFSPDEIFERIVKVNDGMVRYCIENSGTVPKLLGVTNPSKAIVDYDSLTEILEKPDSRLVKARYNNGVVQSSHNTLTPWRLTIDGDIFSTQFHVDTPIDGFGKPAIYVSLLREVCANGMVGYANAFRTELNVGKKENVIFSLERAVQNYSNEEMYTALVDRFKSAGTTFVSVNEAMKLHKLLVKVYNEGGTKLKKLVISKEAGTTEQDVPIFKKFFEVVGDLNSMYGLTNMDTMTQKTQMRMPTKARMTDFINLTTEFATHHCYESGSRRLNGFIGSLIAEQYDLEGSADGTKDWNDLFLANPEVNTALASSHSIIQD